MSKLKCMITLCTFGLSIAATTSSQAGDVLQVNPRQREALGVVVGKVQPRKLVPWTRLPGRITLPNSRVRLITVRSSAVLLSPLVEVGDAVITGQELARLESPAFVSLQRVYLQALSELDLARATASREKQLAQEGIIAGRRAAESKVLLRDAQSRLEEQRQALLLSGMTDKEVRHLAKTHHLNPAVVLRAARSGVVLEQYARAGERLEAGGLIYRIGDLDALTVEIHSPLAIAHLLRKGTRFSLPDEDALGQVISVGGEVHSRDQGVLVRGEIQHGVARLRPGQFVRVQFETARDGGPAFALPSTAVVHAHDQAWLFLEADGGFEPIMVEVLGGSGRESIVVGSLTDESRIALRGTAALKAHWLAQVGSEQ